MFTFKAVIAFRPIFVHKNFIRHLKHGSLKKDPGIGARKKLVSLVNEHDDFIDFEDLESDFMDVHKSHKQHLREKDMLNEKVKYHIVKQKYFKEKFPNFLTWHDKEQIRYLHRTDPEEWTIERLSEGFPALPETITKIVKSNWTKKKQNKITNHDNSVQDNWRLFKNGDMADLPEDLVKHLNKFTNRALSFKPFVIPESPEKSTDVNNVHGEFSDIIKRYQNHKVAKEEVPQFPTEQKVVPSIISKKNPVTLNQLEHDLKTKIKSGKEIQEDEKVIIMNLKPPENSIKEEKAELSDVIQNKYQTSSGIQTYKRTERDLSHLNYPEKITIPKNIFKKGFIYKLNDCYYDDDGEFLYRVPGMG